MSETRSESSLVPGELEMVYSLYDFKATHAKTISFKASQLFILDQTKTEPKKWWEVIDEQGNIGYIPSNYVKTIKISPEFYIKFLNKAIENLKRRDNEDTTQTMARIMELKNQAEKIQAPKSHISSKSDTCIKYNNSEICVEGPTETTSLQKTHNTNVITTQSVYKLIESVRINTDFSHEKSRIAVQTVIQGLHELLPPYFIPYLNTILAHCQSCLVVDDVQIDETHDASRLKILFKELTNCKEDSQQRSWMLHEDEGIIKEYITELISILSNADLSISRHVISCDQFHVIITLIEYYQMEIRWPIRQLLLQAFGVLCSLDKIILDIMLNSVLPGELARDMMANPRNITKLNYSALLLTMVFSMGDPMPVTDLDYFSQQFLKFVFYNIESPPETDVDEQIPDLFLNLMFAFNLQFKEVDFNPIMNLLEAQKHGKTFCEKILLLLNRDEDPIRIFEHQPAPEHSLLKLFKDLFSRPTTAGLFYTNDAKVLIDIIVRNIADLSSGDPKRTEYLELIRKILRNTNYQEHKHKGKELFKCLTRILKEEMDVLSKGDQDLVNEMFMEFPQYFGHY
ncbi:unnamed protein product [Ceutorhynchus assimilis]|uniref:SH3 domain-containing protein n=1 Tax=Ceutorhynchus assimilis TaxID=467358 RepID=A0A9N9QKA8_9CUCU|nr:unnamed protein product [Ceutorhynchus assimilis]